MSDIPLGPDEEPIPVNPATGMPIGYQPPKGFTGKRPLEEAFQQEQQFTPPPVKQVGGPGQAYNVRPNAQPKAENRPQFVPPYQEEPEEEPEPEPQPVSQTMGSDEGFYSMDDVDNWVPNSINEKLSDPNVSIEEIAITEYFPNGLTDQMIQSFKRRFGTNNVYLVNLLERIWIFRGITRIEWVQIKQNSADQDHLEDNLAYAALLWPQVSVEQLRMLPGGIPQSIAEYIMRYSGFGAMSAPLRL